MKKKILGVAMLMLAAAVCTLMSFKSAGVAPVKHKKINTITFTITNSSNYNVSWSFNNASGNVGSVTNAHTTDHVTLNVGTYTVAINNAGFPNSFHMLFNTGENYYAPGHVFSGIIVGPGNSTSLSFY